ncbi:MAG: glutamate-1-semialdehyde 2,1-aminomutase [Chlamydiae bacterium]|nr:glutamate-1-semialdehyde 2,1-aminomutase [Chlamydiota bacterium]
MAIREKSKQVYLSSCKIIPGGVSSPVRSFREVGIDPLIVHRGEGDLLWDVDGNCFIDFCMSWGALILGHAFKGVVDSVIDQMKRGSSFGIATEVEHDLASKITTLVPGVEKVRFVSSGTEAVMSALRVARGYTGRKKIIKFNGNYHGHVDSLLVQAGSFLSLMPEAASLGVPQEMLQNTLSLPYNDVERVRQVIRQSDDLAAVILEPIAANMGIVPASQEFLAMLKEETAKKGALLIFDEVISGFRVGISGASGLYGIIPDLFCFGKIIGGGLPAAAFGGRATIMDCLAPLGGVYQAGTLSGNPLAMQAGIATMTEMEKPEFYVELERRSNAFLEPIKEYIRDWNLPVQIQSVGSLFTFFFSPLPIRSKEDLVHVNQARFREFFQYLFARGVYVSPSQFEANFISIAHTKEHLESVQKIILEFLSYTKDVYQ